MPTEYELNRKAAVLQQRRRQRQKALWLWRRRVLSVLLLGIASLTALVFVIVGIIVPVDEPAEPAPAASLVSSAEAEAETETTQLSEAPVEPAPPGDLSLVNADHLRDFPESDTLVSVYDEKLDSYNVRDTDILLEKRVMEPLNQMLAAFDQETGCNDLLLCAGYRTVEDQQHLWDQSMELHGEEHTVSYIAQPGASEHHTGLALDFAFYNVYAGETYDFDGSGDSAWILEHCWEYGFVQRYPEGKSDITGISTEPWHFRYVGQPHAYLMNQNGLCLEEYLEWLQEYPYDGQHLTVEYAGTNYEIWYCPENDLQYPDSGNYTVSGDNCGGAVITLEVN